MSDKDREVVNSFSKEILDLCNKYVLLGISKIELCTIILNVYTGLFIGLALEIENKEEEEEDETLH
jgi:septum formation topological specificity factor MinE|tara:strand:- start:600 stop:797 length:198 start_codon:yes stop_codon:yes gene_type:complete